MAKLTPSKKKAEPKSDFGLPEERKYPIPDEAHARNAKARASQMEHAGKLSAADKKKIDAKADKKLVIGAAAQAQKAADWIRNERTPLAP